jgi:hypothetical protein
MHGRIRAPVHIGLRQPHRQAGASSGVSATSSISTANGWPMYERGAISPSSAACAAPQPQAKGRSCLRCIIVSVAVRREFQKCNSYNG